MAIRSFGSRALARLHTRDDARAVDPAHVGRLRDILAALDTSDPLAALGRPAYRLHPLRGGRAGQWSVRVSHGWRVTFRIDGPDVWAVRYENYHH